MDRRSLIRICTLMLAAAPLACTSSNPATPTPPPTLNVTATDATLKATQPSLISPGNGELLAGRPYVLAVTASSTPFAPGVPLQYRFQIFDAGGALIEEGLVNSPSWTVVRSLANDSQHTWRVRAEYALQPGPWSDLFAFVTPLRLGTECGPPNNFAPVAIIGCHRARYGDHMEPYELIEMLKGVALDFNVAEISGGPFGVLVKTGGNNCEGYSCDIICAGQGSRQNQWDILIDERVPVWGSDIDGIRPDVCEIQQP